MVAAMRRQTFCGKSHLHHVKSQRSSLSKLDDEDQLKVSLSSPRAARTIRTRHESAIFTDQQCSLTFRTHCHRNRLRPTASFSSSSTSSSSLPHGSSTASLRRKLHEAEDLVTRALVQAQGATVDVPLMSASAPAAIDRTTIPLDVVFDTTRECECQICFDKLDTLQAHVCTSCCGSFCASCTRWYVEYKVQEGEVSEKKMVCPAPQCTRPLAQELIQAAVSSETFAKYETFLANQQVGIRFCPRAGCCAVLEEPLNSSTRRIKCQACKHESCMRCGGDFHKLPICRRVDKRFGHWKKRHNVRGCPGCKAAIEKQGGCSHMKCFQCDQEFCWSCLRPWTNHDETLCAPLRFLRSESPNFGCWTPMRVVTKTAIVGAAAVAAVAGAGLAVVVLPPVLGYQYAKDSYRRHKYVRSSYLRAVEQDADISTNWRAPGY
uniref:RBR-type E3 ubiquitin transferase n=1 Tax=Hyaloperonospora arabidopsidis (strain Emoy2) TaxID=559515 RepID=M4B6J6_HYAAE